MPLDYKNSYKKRAKRRKIILVSGIAGLFLIASALVLVFRYWSNAEEGESFLFFQQQGENVQTENDSSEGKATEANQETVGKYGKALERQKIYLYTIGVAKVDLRDINKEYVRVDETVEDSYFDDALFIGDSRTEGFMLYTSLSNIQAYCSKGLSISRIYTDPIVQMEDGRNLTVMDALQEKKFKKIYIMFGVNELGWPYDDLFIDQYTKLIRDVKSLQPDALIYVENIIPVSAERSASDNIYNNDNVKHFNAMIEQICSEQNVIYLDVASALTGEDGALPADASTDGIHCNKKYCEVWLDYLRNNTYKVQ